MDLSIWWQQSLAGMIGGSACELLHWYTLARTPGKAGRFRKRPLYWGTTAGMILLGAMMPVLYLQGTASAMLCFHLGAATPLLIQKMVATMPAASNIQGDGDSLRAFFAW